MENRIYRKGWEFFLFLFLLAGWLVQARASDDFGFWGSVSAESWEFLIRKNELTVIHISFPVE